MDVVTEVCLRVSAIGGKICFGENSAVAYVN